MGKILVGVGWGYLWMLDFWKRFCKTYWPVLYWLLKILCISGVTVPTQGHIHRDMTNYLQNLGTSA